MSIENQPLPKVGDAAPYFEIETQKGLVRFPEFTKGYWCIFFAHPANFTSAWRMYSNFLAMKERWLNERNTKLLVLANEAIRHNDWSDIVKRYLGIFLKAPVIEDHDHSIALKYGLATGRKIAPPNDRLLYIIDPDGIIRLILHRPLASIQTAIADLERALDRLQGNAGQEDTAALSAAEQLLAPLEQSDVTAEDYKPRPAYFQRTKINLN
ncbi:MAG: redoxin domain-containing protein [Bacteroidetes bacterium]|nr:MAG: redoxin domain-containing protein [Bacteroidota bacterium]